MKQFKDFLSENSFYEDPTTKTEFLKDDKNVAEAFVFGFLGTLALLNSAEDNTKIRSFLRRDRRVKIRNIGDDNHDISLSVKMFVDNGWFKTRGTVEQITRFLAKVKTGKVKAVDSNVVREWLEGTHKQRWVMKLDSRLKRIVLAFMKGQLDLERMGHHLIKHHKMYKETSGEFKQMTRKVKIKQLVTDLEALEGEPTYNEANYLDAKLFAENLTKHHADSDYNSRNDLHELMLQNGIEEGSPTYLRLGGLIDVFAGRTVNSDQLIHIINDRGIVDYIVAVMENIQPPVRDQIHENWLGSFYYDRFNTNNGLRQIMKDAIAKGAWDLQAFLDAAITEEINGNYYSTSTQWDRIWGPNTELFKNMRTYALDRVLSMVEYPLENKRMRMIRMMLRESLVDFASKHTDIAIEITTKSVEAITSLFLEKDITNRFGHSSTRKVIQAVTDNVSSVRESLVATAVKASRRIHDPAERSKRLLRFMGAFIFGNTTPNALLRDYYAAFKDDVIFYLKNPESTVTNMEFIMSAGRFLPHSETTELALALAGNSAAKGLPDPHIDYDADYEARYALDRKESRYKESVIALALANKELNEKSFAELSVYLDEFEDTYLTGLRDSSSTNVLWDIYRKFDREGHKQAALNVLMYAGNTGRPIRAVDPEDALRDGVFDNVSKEQAVDLLKLMDEGKMDWLLSPARIKAISRREAKQRVKDFYFGLLLDNMEDHPDIVDSYFEKMDTYFKTQMRGQLVNAEVLIKEVGAGPILPFAEINNTRMKQILSFNNLSMGEAMKGMPRKKKTEGISSFVKRSRDALENGGNRLAPLAVEEVPSTNDLLLQKADELMLTHSDGRHGDVYPKVNKIFKVTLPTAEFEKFRQRMLAKGIQNESILPSFHGSGGVAATMILRYGFKVIPKTDSSVAGRMLGNGIYFAKNIDKSMQYVGNESHTRRWGTTGYIFQMENQLGEYKEDYDHSHSTRSPEWVVRDARAQLKVLYAYEIELIGKNQFDRMRGKVIEEGLEERKTLKNFMNESQQPENIEVFNFFDGMVYLPNREAMYFDEIPVDFEWPKGVTVEETAHGLSVTFTGTEETLFHDIRYCTGIDQDLKDRYFELMER